jgi:hypothetical protein
MVSSYSCVHIFPIYFVLDRANGRTHKAGLFSAALTGLVIDRSQTIQPTPAQQSAYFQKQSTLLLNQISQQLSSLGAQAPISPNLSFSDPSVSPSASDIRVNICWFMSLVFSLSAALLATLVQRWAQDYMHMFERYNNPLDIARIRQYLRDGVERWGMPTTAEAVPGLIHFSLLLFFIGLADFLLHAYAIVGKFTLFPITFCVTVYIISTVAPIIDPQSPYRTSFSRLFWYLTPKLRPRPCNDRYGSNPKPLSSNMADGQMQLAMEKNNERRDRDERAIGWMAKKLRGYAEMESFTHGIPGSFNTEWGREVWKKHRERHASSPQSADETVPGAAASQNNDQLRTLHPAQLKQEQAIPRATGALRVLRNHRRSQARTRLDPRSERLDVNELCKRILHLFETYDNRDHFLDIEEWRKHSRACVETAASFVFHMKVDLSSFGDIGKLLSDLGDAEKTNKWSETSLNRAFTMRWTCLSLVAARRMLDTKRVRQCAGVNIGLLALYNTVEDDSLDTGDLALNNAKKIDEQFVTAWDCVDELYSGLIHLREVDDAVSEVKKTLGHFEPRLKDIQVDPNSMGLIDMGILTLQSEIDRATHRLTRQLPGVALDTLPGSTPLAEIDRVTHQLIRQLPGVALDTLPGPTPLADIFDFISNPIGPQLLYLRQRLQGLRTLHQETDIREVVSKILEKITTSPLVVVRRQGLMERQLWRLQDLSVGGAFGFTLELYFLALRQLLPSSPSSREFTTFYTGAFNAITSDWEEYKDSSGTQQIILNLVCDIGVRDRGIFSNFPYPDDVTDKLVELLRKVVKGRSSSYINAAMEELRDVGFRLGDKAFRKRAYDTIADSLAAAQQPSNSEMMGLEQSQRRVGISPTSS